MKRRHPDDDPDIPDWSDQEGWRELWALDNLLRERPDSLSRIQRNQEDWD